MKEWTLILGGARSGKSRFAVESIKQKNGAQVFYLASGVAVDEEMKMRIKQHQAERPPQWQTVEASYDAKERLANLSSQEGLILWDCVSFYLNNLIHIGLEKEKLSFEKVERSVLKKIDEIILLKPKMNAALWLVSNEVGGGLVPETPLGRLFRDIAGRVNQKLAAACDQVYLMTAGISTKLK